MAVRVPSTVLIHVSKPMVGGEDTSVGETSTTLEKWR